MDSHQTKDCPICNNLSKLRLRKGVVEYYQCLNCKTLFSEPLDNDNMVGGGFEIERNVNQNHLRIERIMEQTSSVLKEQLNVLDFGCGHGYLIKDLKENGFSNADGYDAYNGEFQVLPTKNKYHIITAIEVIEHTSKPYYELDVMYRSLVNGGIVMIETSFIDVAEQEGIGLEEFFYIDPKVGHSTIFSHHGLDLLMAIKGFAPIQHIDRHVRMFRKIAK